MAGLYIHIPFCRQKCNYCNFYFTTSLRYKEEMIDTILKEIAWQKDYLQGEKIKTIYIGGGTPSILAVKDLQRIFDKVFDTFEVTDSPEITLEANPDDLSKRKLTMLKTTPVNRFSIGVQSFSNEDLRYLNRAHDSHQAENAIRNAREAGFENLTIDLIYGIPTLSYVKWKDHLRKVVELDIPHFSAYALTVEPKTTLAHLIGKGKTQPVNEEQSARQFEMLMDFAEANGYDHYEISNFALSGRISKHNSSYWLGSKYLGIGPAAHSYNGNSRQWNIANNIRYMKSIAQKTIPFEKELLTQTDRYNEYVLTGMRTKWGCDIQKIAAFGTAYKVHFEIAAEPFLVTGKVHQQDGIYRLTPNGMMLADFITSALFLSPG